MGVVPFTDRELTRAWRELAVVATPINGGQRNNSHRLLLFYAVECGLKAVFLKRQNRSVFDQNDVDNSGHDLRKLLKALNVGSNLALPHNLQLRPITIQNLSHPRNGDVRILHQAWRYGGYCITPTDQDCEVQLQQILDWLKGELK
ncbi:hypothetical protein E2H98_15710 [Permianibacter aggregans]|nr:hypothetical protein E2H98_15710 [Permianibacter aggregans]